MAAARSASRSAPWTVGTAPFATVVTVIGAAAVAWGSVSTLRLGYLAPALASYSEHSAQVVALCAMFKLTSSVDDVVWFTPFVAGQSRAIKAARGAQYVFTMVLVAGGAASLAALGRRAIEAHDEQQRGEPLMRLVAGGALLFYSVVLGRQ
eukprot:5272510-Prymnesium_polylepis.1